MILVNSNVYTILPNEFQKKLLPLFIINSKTIPKMLIYSLYINYDNLNDEERPDWEFNKYSKIFVYKEKYDFLNLTSELKPCLADIVTVDKEFRQITRDLNPMFKNLLQKAYDFYFEERFDDAKSMLKDFIDLVGNYDFVQKMILQYYEKLASSIKNK